MTNRISSQMKINKYEQMRKQDLTLLQILTETEEPVVNLEQINLDNNYQSSSKSCFTRLLITYIKSITSLKKRREILNSKYMEHLNATPLMLLILKYHNSISTEHLEYKLAEIAEFMIKNGADIRLIDDKKRNVYHYIAKYGNYELLKIIMREENNLISNCVNTSDSNFQFTRDQLSSKKSLSLAKHFEMSRLASGDGISFKTPPCDEDFDEASESNSCTSQNTFKVNTRIQIKTSYRLEKEINKLRYQTDIYGYTPLHLAVISRCSQNNDQSNDSFRLIKLLSFKSASHFILDQQEKLPIDYCEKGIVYSMLKNHMQVVSEIYTKNICEDSSEANDNILFSDEACSLHRKSNSKAFDKTENNGFTVNGQKCISASGASDQLSASDKSKSNLKSTKKNYDVLFSNIS